MRRVLGVILIVVSLAVPGAAGAVERPFVDPALLHELSRGPAIAVLVADEGELRDVVGRLDRLAIPNHAYPRLGMAAVALEPNDLDDVVRLPGVDAVWANSVMHAFLDKAAPYIGAKAVWEEFSVTGKGVTVLVVDTGVDGTHPDLPYGSKVVENVVPQQARDSGLVQGSLTGVASSDADGHGTHVAGIVGGLGSGLAGQRSGVYRGIAPGAALVGFQAGVVDETGEPTFEVATVLEAYEWALDNRDRFGIRVVSNSWGRNGVFDPLDPVNRATLVLYQAGLVVAFAAGNEGEDGAGTLNPYCVAPWVLCVGAGNFLNNRAAFSSYGAGAKPFDHPDLLAPGVEITAPKASSDTSGGATGGILGSVTGAQAADSIYTDKSGTSMATPVVSGVAALLLEANPALSPDQVYDILATTAEPLSDPVAEVGAGYLNARDAVELAKDTKGEQQAFLAGDWKYAGPASGDDDYALDPVTVGYGVDPARSEPFGAGPTDVAKSLVGTLPGLIFLLGTAALVLFAYRFEGGIKRRRPVSIRSVGFFLGLAFLVVGLVRGLDWIVETDQFLGTYVFRFLIGAPTTGGAFWLWMALGLAGFVLLFASVRSARSPERSLLGPRMRFYPRVALVAAFLLLFGAFFLFNASYRGGAERDGVLAFVALDYAGALDRSAQSLLGLAVLLAGAYLLLVRSWGFGAAPEARTRPVGRPAAGAPARPATGLSPERTSTTR